MVEVVVRDGDLDRAIRVFKKKTSSIKTDVRRREFYLSRSERRKLKDRIAERRARRAKQRQMRKRRP